VITIPVKTRGLPEADVEVVVVLQLVDAHPKVWPEDFFTQVAAYRVTTLQLVSPSGMVETPRL